MTDPRTPDEWQDAVDAAEGALVLDSARRYGLVTGGPDVNVERCEQLLRMARERGITPAADAVKRFIKALLKTGIVKPITAA